MKTEKVMLKSVFRPMQLIIPREREKKLDKYWTKWIVLKSEYVEK